MPKSTVVYQQDGSFSRVGDVEQLDVSRGTQQPEPTVMASPPAAPVQQAPVQNTPQPGTFSLSNLRSTIKQSTPAPPPEPEPEVVPEPEPVQEVQDPAPQSEPMAAEPAPVAEEAVVTEGPVAAEVGLERGAEDSVVQEVAEPIEKEEPAPEPKAPTAFNLSSLAQVKKTPPVESKGPEKRETPAVQEMHLEEVTVLSSDPAPAVSAPQPVVEESSVTSQSQEVGAFVLTSIGEVAGMARMSMDDIGHWAVRCVKQRSRAPAAIFCSQADPALRFYNYFESKAKGTIGVVIGYGNNVAGATLALKIGGLRPFDRLATDGVFVTLGKRVLVTSSELKQEAMKV